MRSGVTLSGATLCLALFAQLVVWGFVHFMDVRVERLGPSSATGASLEVVTRAAASESALEAVPPKAAKSARSSGRSLVAAPPKASETPFASAVQPADQAGVDVNVVKTLADLLLRRIAGLVQTIGIISALALGLLMFQGVVIAGGAQAPGVEYCVTASYWGLVIIGLCVPMSVLAPGSPFDGVFAPYSAVAAAADAFRTGSPTALGASGYFGMYLLLPVLTAFGAVACVLRFRAGVEEGVIVTSVSQLDEKIEREIRTSKWGAITSPRAMGALNKAIGDRPGGAEYGSNPNAPNPGERMGMGGEGPDLPPGMALRRPI